MIIYTPPKMLKDFTLTRETEFIKVSDVIKFLKGYQRVPNLMTDQKCVYLLTITFLKIIEKERDKNKNEIV
jgi:hypothetical protein